MGTPAIDRFPVRLWASLTLRALRAVGAEHLDYGPCQPLRAAIAEHVQRSRGLRCLAAQVLIVSGTQSGLDLLARVLLDPGDMAWLEEPGYIDVSPAMSSGSGVSLMVSHAPELGHMVAVSTGECPSPRKWPNSCAPVFSM